MTPETNWEIEIKAKEILEKEVAPIVLSSHALEIKTNEDSVLAQELIKEVKRKQKSAKETFHPAKEAAKSAYDKIRELEARVLDPYEKAEAILKRKVCTWDDLQEAIRIEEMVKKQKEAEAIAEREKARLLEKAVTSDETGDTAAAERYLKIAASVTPDAGVLVAETVKATGTSFRKKWKGEVTDKAALMRWAIDTGRLELFEVKQAAVNSLAAANENKAVIPGLKMIEEKIMASRI